MLNKEDIEAQIKLAKITKESLKADNSSTAKTAKIVTEDTVIKPNINDNKSILKIGNIVIYNTKKFNWFQRKMFKIFFGIKINNLKSKGDE